MEYYIDPGLRTVSYLVYDSHTHNIIRWHTDECFARYAFAVGLDSDVDVAGLGIEHIAGIIGLWMDDHRTMLDKSHRIYVEGQSPNLHTKSGRIFNSKMIGWIYMLKARYPDTVEIIAPKSLKTFVGGCTKSWANNKKRAIEYVDGDLLETSLFYTPWQKLTTFTARHNMADPYVMMRYIQENK